MRQLGSERLGQLLRETGTAALAFSGGVDSAYLLYRAVQEGCAVVPIYIKTPFQPEFELQDAQRIAREVGVDLRVLPLDILSVPHVRENPPDRCYYCKRALFSRILEAAVEAGAQVVFDGTNASDSSDDRPGMRAICELGVRSPLRECGLTKSEIRALSKEAGLFTWDKPAYACLATRVPSGTEITPHILERTERAEERLAKMGFRDFRVRLMGDAARLQVLEEQLPRVLNTDGKFFWRSTHMRRSRWISKRGEHIGCHGTVKAGARWGNPLEQAHKLLQMQPFEDLGYAKVDHHRRLRQGAAEVVYGAGKTPEQILGIARALLDAGEERVLITRMSSEAAQLLQASEIPLQYDSLSRVGVAGKAPLPRGKSYIAVVTGGHQ